MQRKDHVHRNTCSFGTDHDEISSWILRSNHGQFNDFSILLWGKERKLNELSRKVSESSSALLSYLIMYSWTLQWKVHHRLAASPLDFLTRFSFDALQFSGKKHVIDGAVGEKFRTSDIQADSQSLMTPAVVKF